jgi:hypothetical protein
MSRDHLSDEEREAMRILDLLKAGDDTIPASVIAWCLRVTGDAIGLR